MDRQATGHDGKAKGLATGAPSITFDSRAMAGADAALAGFALGTQVVTLDGLLPVEYLAPGDRIVTRAGARVLRGLSSLPMVTNLVQVASGALGHDRPGQDLLLGAGTQVLLRDWRARAMFGTAQALVAVSRLVDGQFVRPVTGRRVRLFTLHFDAPEVIYADGVEIGCAPLSVGV